MILVSKCGGDRGEEKDVEKKNAIEDEHAQTGADRATRRTPTRPRACVCGVARESVPTRSSVPHPAGFKTNTSQKAECYAGHPRVNSETRRNAQRRGAKCNPPP